MKLATLLEPWLTLETDLVVTGLQHDSRLITPGDLFVAFPGAAFDGRDFIQQAVQVGAVAVVYEPQHAPDLSLMSIPCIALPGLAQQLGQLASRFYANPSQQLSVIGVTGTNGKTTIAFQLAQAYEHLACPSAYIGTLGIGACEALLPLRNTTPDALTLQRAFSQMHTQGIQVVCMEVSSHALDQGRVTAIAFKHAVFTNLTHDHLDYHHTLQSYAEAKAKLFAMPMLQNAIINGDDEVADLMEAQLSNQTRCIRYGLHANNLHVRADAISSNMTGSLFTIHSPWGEFVVKTRALGEFNIYNSLVASGCDAASTTAIMPQLIASPGRMQIVHTQPVVIVDYAHTPDALENVLKTLTALKQASLIVVFGCGGDRDKTKRPLMGAIACRYADRVILTNDNPRTEAPEAIVQDIQAGMTETNNVSVCLDRQQAIQLALQLARADDLILIAGKGHENYQEIGHERLTFSDQAVVKDCFQN